MLMQQQAPGRGKPVKETHSEEEKEENPLVQETQNGDQGEKNRTTKKTQTAKPAK